MAKLTVTEAAEMIGVSRQTIYRKLHDGTLSRDANKKVDLSELMRVFPPSDYDYVTPSDVRETSQSDTSDAVNVSGRNNDDATKDRLIAHLEAENELLRAEKAQYWEAMTKAQERADAMLAALPDLTKKLPWWKIWKK